MDEATLIKEISNYYQCEIEVAKIVMKSAEKNGTIKSLVKVAEVSTERREDQ